MGFLHQGHLSLIKKARVDNDILVLSIFVNPTQFGPKEDFKKYPRNLRHDLKLAKESGVDIVFAPNSDEMYKADFETYVHCGNLSAKLCGLIRPGHFKGVCVIVAKLFNLIEPDVVYFGQKDYQQVRIIIKMIEDLNFNIKVKMLPIFREFDGLAMSSRNRYLSTTDRKKAAVIYRALKAAERAFKKGCKKTVELKKMIKKSISDEKCVNIEYIEIIDDHSLEEIKYISGKVVVAISVKIKATRLIDNIILKP